LKSRVSIGLVNPKSPSNVGAVLRAAGCYRAECVLYTGERFDKATKFQTDTKNRLQTTPLKRVIDFSDELIEDTKLVCFELVEGATPLAEFEHPEQAIYVFGPEDGSLSQTIIDRADHIVYVPTVGCMNLAASVNVVLYDRQSKTLRAGSIDERNEQIRVNRDQNNRLKIRPWKTGS